MTLPLPAVTAENLQFILDLIARTFPLTAEQLATGSVGSDQIAANAVGSSELADDAVDTAAIQAAAVTSAKLGVGTLRVLTAGIPSLNYGSGTVTFTASQHSATTNITHGLGTTPVTVQLTGDGTGVANAVMEVISLSGTTIGVQGFDPTAVRTGDTNFFWLAIG